MVSKQDSYIDKLIRIMFIIAITTWAIQLVYPLLGVLAWGFILAVIFYPFYRWLNSRLKIWSGFAATIVTICILLILISVTFFISSDIAQTIRELTVRIHANQEIIPKPPETIAQWPFVGDQLYQAWSAASTNLGETISQYSESILSGFKFMLAALITKSKDFILFIISIILAGFLMVKSSSFMNYVRKFAERVAPENSDNIINIIKETMQNVSRGVLGIALLQTLILWLLLSIAHTPGAGLLSLLGLLFCIAQLGLFIIIVPVIAWLFLTKAFSFALIITIFLILDTLLDNLLKPVVLARGLPTPMMIIFIGLIGGILVYGLIGVFIGPVVLAIAYELLGEWIEIKTYKH